LTYSAGEAPADLLAYVTFGEGGQPELVTMGSDPTPLYAGSFFTPISGGFRATLVRGGPWPKAPTLNVNIVDEDGQSASASWTWALVNAAVGTGQVIRGNLTSTDYGSDARTFLNLGNGQDMDPMLLIVDDPRVVVTEAIARRLTMALGTLWYSPSDGFDLLSILNRALSTKDVINLQGQIQQECLKDQRVATASVNVTFVTASTARVLVILNGATGPFTAVFMIDSKTQQAVVQSLNFQ
jgi:hypothetical protein